MKNKDLWFCKACDGYRPAQYDCQIRISTEMRGGYAHHVTIRRNVWKCPTCGEIIHEDKTREWGEVVS